MLLTIRNFLCACCFVENLFSMITLNSSVLIIMAFYQVYCQIQIFNQLIILTRKNEYEVKSYTHYRFSFWEAILMIPGIVNLL